MSGKIKKNNKKINVTFFAGYVGIYLFIYYSARDSERRFSDSFNSWLNVSYPRVQWQQNA